ncbi:hypothetical protein BUALT_Bualt05G0120900 [Buddleja alternifolia]|uniref:PB1 domain-containing protein n=1 Tax=Buddleja alternifolia TaxID=168488 RepID=A0AAV6XQI2_9LAMI|nr:hypothetical protein BUALT_Bualt05G0120900 [Buddleja alternifolia]
MEAPPPQPPLSTPPPAPTTTPPPLYPDSVDSSPRSRHTDSWDADPPPSQPPPKLRVMCSYGGHIIPRPHDKSLCYIGGDTRIIVIDRHTSLSDLHRRLSKNLLHNQPSFSLKYQLPNEDLDSLISISTDEDLENMVEEYDRLNNGGQSKTGGRLRLFLFPKTSSNIEVLVETASIKSEDWFLDALNGKSSVGVSDREFSECSSVNNLLGLDDDFATKAQIEASSKVDNSGNGNGGKSVNSNQELNTVVVPDSPMLERTSSFGSTSSSPSTANLPPIKVRVRAEENPKVGGFEEQFQQMSVGNVNLVPPQKQQEEVGGFVAAVGTVVSGMPVAGGGGEYGARIFSDDERSDHGGYRKVQQIQPQVQPQFQQQQQQIPQFQQIPSPDSVSSEGSITNPLSRQRQAMYQEQFQSGNTRYSANQIDPKTVDQNNTKIHESNYVLSGQFDQNHPHLHQQQQFIHAGAQYMPTGAMPIPSYYPMYPSQQQPVIDQNYPVYPLYYPSTRPQTRSVPSSKPEMAAGVYRTSAAASPQLVQVPPNQHQAQYVGYNTQFHHPSQSMNPPSAGNSNYTYEFADPNHAQMYYTHLPPQMAAQYQTVTSAGLPDGSAQLPTENIRTSQP